MHAGFAAGCEAGLRPAVSILNWLGYAPGSGLALNRRAKPGPGAQPNREIN